jgi:FkbM family methyltransferase
VQFWIDRVADHSFVGSWLGPESVVIDLGMNLGKFSYEVQRRYGCSVVGVEANPALARSILQTDRLSCSNIAITGKTGPVEFFIDPHQSEASTIYPEGFTNGLQRVVVEGKTFTDFVKAERLRHIDLLKIDIEGAELDLLRFIPDSVLQDIQQICVEFHSFMRPQDTPQVKAVIAGVRARNFFVLDFARDLTNVLMINERQHRLTLNQRALLYKSRNLEGMKRIVNRALSRA